MKFIQYLSVLTMFLGVVIFQSCDEAETPCASTTNAIGTYNVTSATVCLNTGSITISQGGSDEDFNISYTDGTIVYPTWTGAFSDDCSTIVVNSLPATTPFIEFDGGTITISGNSIVSNWSFGGNEDNCTINATK
ncbi:MAG: hypothetical protein R2728_11165 [Chitinophagales bacterium]